MTKLLVLSEDPQVIETVSQLTGCEIVLLRDSDQGLHEASWSTAVLLIDMAYPNITSMADVIQQYINKEHRVLVIAESTQQTEIAEFINRGIDDYLLKPVHPVLLEKRVRRIRIVLDTVEFMLFAANELKTSLVPVAGWAELILHEIGNAEIESENGKKSRATLKKLLEIIRDCALRTEDRINDFRDETRLNADRELYVEMQPVEITSIVKSVIEKMARRLEEHEVRVEIRFPEDLPVISGDSYRLKRLIWHLLSSALKQAEPKPVITISAHTSPEFLHISLENGNEEIMDQSENWSAPYGGMSLARAIIQAHGGEVWVEKNSDQSFTVYFTLPIAKSPDSESSV